jgi:chorismate mutase
VAEAMVATVIFDHLTRLSLLHKTNRLKDLRDTIDQIDHSILLLLSERQSIVKNVGKFKKRSGRKVSDKVREQQVLRRKAILARELDLDEKVVMDLWRTIMKLAKSKQKENIGKKRS